MPARVMVRRELMGLTGQLAAPVVAGDGLDQLDPSIPLAESPFLQAAFAVGAPLVTIRGVLASCRFRLVGDSVEFVKLENQTPRAYRTQIYEFSEWI